VPIVLKSGSLNLLESYGPVQACNGIALPFTSCVKKTVLICYQLLTVIIQSHIYRINGFGLGLKLKVTGSHTLLDPAATKKN
jgi:hypothetical protein